MRIFRVLSLSLTLFITVSSTFDENDYILDVSSSSSLNPSPLLLPPPPQPSNTASRMYPFRPSIAVIVGILTTVFSITFLLLLYAKHCKRGGNYSSSNNNGINNGYYPSSTARKNSGIDPAVIDSLPIFRFGSLRGEKDGLECAVCLNRFEPTEVLRLLPKCKHAFHVECVDTWLDAHSTCPLCRYRVDPEDILLVDESSYNRSRSCEQVNDQSKASATLASSSSPSSSSNGNDMHRVPTNARHSSAGERGAGASSSSLEVIVEKPGQVLDRTASLIMSRRSLDSWRSFNRKPTTITTSSSTSRRSLDSWRSFNRKSNNNEIAVSGVGCFDRPRKDELLMEDKQAAEHRRLEHRIIISGPENTSTQQRWSDVESSDLLFLRSEMILSDSRRFLWSRGSRSSVSRQRPDSDNNNGNSNNNNNNDNNDRAHNSGGGSGSGSGRKMINNERSVSEMTGLSRLRSNEGHGQQHRQRQQVRRDVVSRWLAWISHSQSHSQSQPAGGVGVVSSSSSSSSS